MARATRSRREAVAALRPGQRGSSETPAPGPVFLFDFPGHASDFWHPDTPHLFKNLRDGPAARLHLQALQKALPNALGRRLPSREPLGDVVDASVPMT